MCARHTYHLFKRADGGGCCAVRQDQPIPGFLDGRAWVYVRSTDVARDVPLGFDPLDADEATRSRGFYLYSRPVPVLRTLGARVAA